MSEIENQTESHLHKYSKYYRFILIAIALLAFALAIWYAYNYQINSVDEDNLPIIYAQDSAKSKPDDPGGLVVENRDKDIFDHMSGKKVGNKNIKTTKASEEPLSKEEVANIVDRQIQSEEIEDASISKQERKIDELKKLPSNTPSIVIQNDDIAMTSDASPGNKPAKIYSVRLAKLKSKDLLDKAWKVMLIKYGDIVGDLKPKLKAGTNGEEGIFYLEAGELNSEKKAQGICDKLRDKGKHCVIVQNM